MFTRALSPRTQNANGQSLLRCQLLRSVSTRPTAFTAFGPGVFVVLVVCLFGFKIGKKLSSLYSLPHEPPHPPFPNPRWQDAVDAGAFSPACWETTCGQKQSKMTIAMLVMPKSLREFQDLSTSWMLKKCVWHLVQLMSPRWGLDCALDCVVTSLKKGLRSFAVKTSREFDAIEVYNCEIVAM